MDELLKALGGSGGGPIQQLAKQFGIPEDKAEEAIGKLAPALAGAIGRNTEKPEGMASLQGALTAGGHRRYVDDPASLEDPATTEDGNAILGHLLGSKDESRRVAGEAADATGLDVGTLKQMLPLVAGLFMGSLSSRAGPVGAGNDAGGLGSILEGFGVPAGGGGGPSAGGGGGLGGLLGKFLKRR